MEINLKYVKLFSQGIDKKDGTLNQDLLRVTFRDDIKNITKYVMKESVNLVITSPPYSNLLNIIRKEFADKDFKGNKYKNQSRKLAKAYSDSPFDLGNLSYDKYITSIKNVMKKLFFIAKRDAIMYGL